MNAHQRASEIVQEHLLGESVQEIIPFAGCWFAEIGNTVVEARDFIKQDDTYYHTRILHILSGNNIPMDIVIACIEKAYRTSSRLIILEHKPGIEKQTTDRFNTILSIVSDLDILKVDIDDRNVVFIATNLHGWDKSRHELNRKVIKSDIAYIEGAGRKSYEVLLFTSERQECGRLLTVNDAEKVAETDKEVWCVCGGLMFLNLIAEIPNRPITLIDLSAKQLLYAHAVVETIKVSNTLAEFDANINNPVVDSPWSLSHKYLRVRDEKCVYWDNLVRIGHWRDQYETVRKSLDIKYHYGPIDTSPIPENAIVYTSTVDPSQYSNLKNPIIEAFSERDTPRLHL